MKKFVLFVCVLALVPLFSKAQKPAEVEQGIKYFLPKTALRFTLLIEKEVYTPGELNEYAEKYLHLTDVMPEAYTSFGIVSLKTQSYGIPDSTKQYTAKMDQKHSISKVERNEAGVLLAINRQGRKAQTVKPFAPARKPQPLNPKEYLSQEILSAGSLAKMAELCAAEIYDIRESRSLLAKGQADFMPKDGEQLKTMLSNLDTQERALLQLFEGTTERDTVEKVIEFVPQKEVTKQVLFRFSTKQGLMDIDDLGGKPYYITIEDLHISPELQTSIDESKFSQKDDAGVHICLPGKIRITLHKAERLWTSQELYAAQFGHTEPLNGNLFGKKFTTQLLVNPITGNVESIQTEVIKK